MVTLEAAPVEELSLRAQPLHDINTTAAEITHITAAHVHRKLLLRSLQVRSERSIVRIKMPNTHIWVSSSYRPGVTGCIKYIILLLFIIIIILFLHYKLLYFIFILINIQLF